MAIAFDPGYHQTPFVDLCQTYPGASVYDPADFRVEWGPIFHRGRLDGSARVLVVGQDPAQHEAIVRRILVGTAGQRTQGFLSKLGITRSYVMINTFIYGIYGQGAGEKHKNDAGIVAYRNRWFNAVLGLGGVEAVVALGSLADGAWKAWLGSPNGASSCAIAYQHIKHPTWPESASHNDETDRRAKTKLMLTQWNAAIEALTPRISNPDVDPVFAAYSDDFLPSDLVDIPPDDFPAGLPAWMRSNQGWAVRGCPAAVEKRRTISMTVPQDVVV